MPDAETSPTPKRRRRRVAISLRAMMVLVIVVGLPMGWKARRASLQRRAIAAVERAGGSVRFDYQGRYAGCCRAAKPGPAWLREWVGNEYFREVAAVWITRDRKDEGAVSVDVDAIMTSVLDFDRLTDLHLEGAQITRAGLEKVARLPGLEILEFEAVGLGDDDLGLLRGLTRLTSLWIRNQTRDGSKLTGVGLAHLSGMTRMERLIVEGAELDSPADLAPLAGMTSLEILELDRSPRDEACLAPLRGLKRIEFLQLRNTQVGDVGMKAMAGLEWLTEIHIDASKLTDVGLAELARFEKLEVAELRDLAVVTEAGLAQLSAMKELRALSLTGARIDGSCLAHVPDRYWLDRLDLSNSSLTDAGLARMNPDRIVDQLDLSRTAITDAGLVALAKIHVSELNLSETRISDDGLSSIARSPGLNGLNLSHTAITDAGLIHLATLDHLMSLDLRGTKVTKAGLALVDRFPRRKVPLVDGKVHVIVD